MRELADRVYSPLLFSFVFAIARLLVHLASVLIYFLIYALSPLGSETSPAAWGLSIACYWSVTLVCEMLGLAFYNLSGSLATAFMLLMALTQVFQLTSGFFISLNRVPWAIRWVAWINPLRYGHDLVTIAEFDYGDCWRLGNSDTARSLFVSTASVASTEVFCAQMQRRLHSVCTVDPLAAVMPMIIGDNFNNSIRASTSMSPQQLLLFPSPNASDTAAFQSIIADTLVGAANECAEWLREDACVSGRFIRTRLLRIHGDEVTPLIALAALCIVAFVMMLIVQQIRLRRLVRLTERRAW